MRKPLFLISLVLSSTACSPTGDAGEDGGAVEGVAATPTRVAAQPDEAKAFAFTDNAERGDGNREFAYSWPEAVAREAGLVDLLDREREAALAEQKADWDQSFADVPEGCVSCISRGYEKEWKVVADLPRWLSLSADLYVYTGGAHGTYGRTSLVWDREGKKAIEGIEMFKSPVALETALGAQLCDALDRSRAKRRGAPVERTSEWGSDCPGIDEAAVFVGSSNGETFDRIGVYFGPYVAGSYAEGAHELNFPVTASVLDAVKPEYAGTFSVKR